MVPGCRFRNSAARAIESQLLSYKVYFSLLPTYRAVASHSPHERAQTSFAAGSAHSPIFLPAAQLAISIPKDFAAICAASSLSRHATSCYQGCAQPTPLAYEGCAIYHGSDNRLYLRFKPSDLYHIAFSVDSMYVGNGYVLKRNDIEVVVDPSASL
jgi:hypothetical protein